MRPAPLLALVLLAALAVAAPKAAVPLPEMAVARTPTPPTIDGKLAEGEWDRAAACSAFTVAFHGQLAKYQSVAWVTYDDQFLYVALRNNRGPHDVLLSKRARETDDEAIVFDHSNEIWITPPGTPQATYQTLFNAYPGVFDVKHMPSVGYTAKSWNGRWTIASSETRDHWIVEARAPLASFGVETIADGARWQGLFTTDVLGKGGGFRAWAPGGAFADIPRHGHLHFSGTSAVFQLLDVESVFTGKAAFRIAVSGPSGSVQITARLGVGVTPANGDRVVEKVVQLKDWARQQLTIEADLTALALPKKKVVVQDKPRVEKEFPHGFCELTAKTDAGLVLYHQVFPFTLDGHVRKPPAEIKRSPYDTPFGLQAFYAPFSKKLLVKVDRLYMTRRRDVMGGRARLLDPRTKKAVATESITPFRLDYSQFPIDLQHVDVPVQTEADWARQQPIVDENKKLAKEGKPPKPVPGPQQAQYTLEVVLSDPKGAAVDAMTLPVKLMGYQFEWLPNTVGISDKVIPPWTPMKWDDGVVTVWNKRIRLNGLGLAEEVVNAGRKQLAGPMQMVAVVGGKEMPLQRVTGPRLEKLTEATARLAGRATFHNLAFRCSTRVEFDGFVLNTMTIEPRRPTALDRLTLVVRMPKAEAPCFVTTAGGWSAVHGWTPKRWTSKETASGSRVGNFVPYVFLTDSERGFCWFADNDRGWLLDPDQPTLELATKGDEVELRVNFITKGGALKRSTTLRYGWMVTPQKPQWPGWRATHIEPHKPYPKAHTVFYGMDQTNWAVLWPYYSSPYPWDYAKSKKAFDRARASGTALCAGNIAHAIARYRDAKGRWFNALAADWGTQPGDRSNGNVIRCRGTNDFQLWHYDQWIRKSGLNGLYFDENYLGEEWNDLQGTAYRTDAGRVQPGYSYLGLREFNKRIRYLFHGYGLAPPRLWLHTTSGHPVHAWMPDVAMEAENVEPANADNDYMECLPASRLRAIGMGRNLGAAPVIMCQADRHWKGTWCDRMIEQFLGWVLAHDCLPESAGLPWPVLAAELEMWQPDIRFVPYWKSGLGLESRTRDVVVSAHVRKGHVVLWVVNTSHDDRTATVRLDLPKLGLDARKLVAFDAETGERHRLSRGLLARRHTLKVAVPKRFWRAIRLVETERLRDGVTFVASFDGNEVAADEAFGHRYARGRGPHAVHTVPIGMAGSYASLDDALHFDARHHVSPERGRVAFHLRVAEPTKASGVLFAIDRDLTLRLDRGKLRLHGAKSKTLAEGDVRLAPEWNAIAVTWRGKALRVTVDGKDLLSVALDKPIPIRPMGRGLQIQSHRKRVRPTRLTFGPLKGAAMDDLTLGL